MLKRLGTVNGLAGAIDTARARTLDWLASMQASDHPKGVLRISVLQEVTAWPGMLLPGTYNGIMCRDLLDGMGGFSAPERRSLTAWLEAQRLADGRFRITGMNDVDVFKKPDRGETWRYIDWHVSNYSLGAIDAIEPGRTANLRFITPYLDPLTLKAWLADRDLRDPWQEGNNIVNLASFLLLMRRDGDAAMQAKVNAALDIFRGWHDRLREPTTGFWGVGQLSDRTRMLHAFAGSMHNFHLWYHEGWTLEAQDKAVDYCLSLPPAIDSACIDVDAVDVLIHGWRLLDHRRAEIEAWLATMLEALLGFQNPDGGFCDVRAGIRRQDGWVKGYEEPQGHSNTFATWFRWIAIAMIADVLWPQHWNWRFRRMIGIGFRFVDWHGRL